MRIPDFQQRLADIGAKPRHIGRMTRAWLKGLPLDVGRRQQQAEDFLPLSVREGLPALSLEIDALARLRSEHPAADGSARLLVELGDGQMVESVLLPRDGLCVSSQVGCAVGCVFCMTGKSGLLRQLGSAEIVAQVALARRFRPVKKVVFMGMGEPAHNLDNVLEAIDLLGTEGGIGHKNLVFSTVGDLRVFERLPQQRIKPALALSLLTMYLLSWLTYRTSKRLVTPVNWLAGVVSRWDPRAPDLEAIAPPRLPLQSLLCLRHDCAV